MGYFKSKFYENFVSLTRGAFEIHGTIPLNVFSCWNNLNQRNFDAPYIDCVKEYMEDKGEYAQKKLLLVTDDRNMVMKTAALIADHICNDDEDDDWDDYDDYDDEPYEGEKVILIDFPSATIVDKKELYCQTLVANTNVSGLNNVLFIGAGTFNDWDTVLQSLSICKLNNQFVEVEPEQLSLPVVQRLIYEFGFEVLRLPKFSRDYYEKEVLDFLLDGAPYNLSVSCGKKEWLRRLQKKRGVYFGEEDIAIFLDMGAAHATRDGGRTDLQLIDFKDSIAVDVVSAWDKLMAMTGLQNMKIVAEEEIALMTEQLRNDKLQCGREHMIFYGKPGTGKTTCASILADVFNEAGCGNGSLVVATRKDLVGEYVGHTAPKVAKRFEEARGGILFVDEAGFFLNKESGGFVNEALKEFVRYMEQYTDVTVIFAMYPQEAKAFLELDEGLNSRIKRNVEFCDYTDKELLEIAVKMTEDNGYSLSKRAYPMVKEYIVTAREEERGQFGNARNMRKLVDAAIKELSLRHFRNPAKASSRTITEADVKNAIEKMKNIQGKQAISFGFGMGSKQTLSSNL